MFVAYYLSTEQNQPTWRTIAERHRLRDWKDAAHRAEWVKGRLAKAIRDEVHRYVDSEDAVDDELRDFFK